MLEALSTPLPRYVWRATAYKSKDPIFDLLFDATDIEHGKFVVRIIKYENTIPDFLSELASGPESDIEKNFTGERGKKIFKAFKKRPTV